MVVAKVGKRYNLHVDVVKQCLQMLKKLIRIQRPPGFVSRRQFVEVAHICNCRDFASENVSLVLLAQTG